MLIYLRAVYVYTRKCEEKHTLSKLLRRRAAFVPRPAPVVLALSVEATGATVDSREPRFLKVTVAVPAGVTALSVVDNE